MRNLLVKLHCEISIASANDCRPDGLSSTFLISSNRALTRRGFFPRNETISLLVEVAHAEKFVANSGLLHPLK